MLPRHLPVMLLGHSASDLSPDFEVDLELD
jgi:hypothetical protein